MNNFKIKIYKTVLKEVWEKYDGAEDFINRENWRNLLLGEITGGRGNLFCLWKIAFCYYLLISIGKIVICYKIKKD